jgi:hypothetical protein
MRQSRVIAILAGTVLAAAMVPSTLARSNVGGSCGSGTNSWQQVTLDGWYWNTVTYGYDGDEALAIEELAALLGVDATHDAVYAAIVAGVGAWDKNDNGFICMKNPKDTPGLPSYIFIVKDDSSSA